MATLHAATSTTNLTHPILLTRFTRFALDTLKMRTISLRSAQKDIPKKLLRGRQRLEKLEENWESEYSESGNFRDIAQFFLITRDLREINWR